MDLSTFQELLSFLPPQVQSYVLGALAFIGMLGVAVLGAKSLILHTLGTPQPTDPAWKTRIYKALGTLDALGLNMATFQSLIEIARKEKEIRRLNAEAPPAPKLATFPPPPGPDAGVEP